MTPVQLFEPHRRHLFGLAYRMLASVADAEDIVQDAYLRWQTAPDRAEVTDPRAYLSRIATRLCLDRLKSARARREVYPGPWLPEPITGAEELTAGEIAHDLSVALLLTLERLSPLERAVFLLHDVFDIEFPEIAERLHRSPAACRQLASRARQHIRAAGPGHQATPDQEHRLKDAFLRAVYTGDTLALTKLLAQDALCLSDGGGKANAAPMPVRGADRVARLLIGVSRKFPLPADTTVQYTRLNGMPAFIVWQPDLTALQTVTLEMNNGQITGVYIMRNPDKLRHLHAEG